MLDESHFHAVAEATLAHLFDRMEDAFDNGTFEELELTDGVLRIEDVEGNVWVINRHNASRQIWLASKRLGGLHFSFNHDEQAWMLPDGRNLKDILSGEIQAITGAHIVF